eukprot:2117023-Pleurochrysis_carterae.AAC.1
MEEESEDGDDQWQQDAEDVEEDECASDRMHGEEEGGVECGECAEERDGRQEPSSKRRRKS